MPEPDSFLHLTPEERVYVARRRLQSTSVILVEVLRLNAQREAILGSAIADEVATNEAAETLARTSLAFEIVQIYRIWDKFDASSYGILTIASLLRGDDMNDALRFAVLPHAGLLREPTQSELAAGEARLDHLNNALAEASSMDGSSELERIRNYRNKYIAHPLFRTKSERRRSIQDAQVTDIDFCISKAIAVLTPMQQALIPYDMPDYSALQMILLIALEISTG